MGCQVSKSPNNIDKSQNSKQEHYSEKNSNQKVSECKQKYNKPVVSFNPKVKVQKPQKQQNFLQKSQKNFPNFNENNNNNKIQEKQQNLQKYKPSREECNRLCIPRSASSKHHESQEYRALRISKYQQFKKYQEEIQQEKLQKKYIGSLDFIDEELEKCDISQSECQEDKSQNINYSYTVFNNLELYNGMLGEQLERPTHYSV